MKHTGRFTLCAGLLAVLWAASPLAAQQGQPEAIAAAKRYWTSIGATGIPDEASAVNIITNDTGSIAIKPQAGKTTAYVRYNITAVEALTYGDPTTASNICLSMMARDLGASDRVRLRLKTMDNRSDVITTVALLDSDAFAGASDSYREMTTCNFHDPYLPQPPPPNRPLSGSWVMNFVYGRVYWLEAELVKFTASGNPGLKMIWMGREPDDR